MKLIPTGQQRCRLFPLLSFCLFEQYEEFKVGKRPSLQRPRVHCLSNHFSGKETNLGGKNGRGRTSLDIREMIYNYEEDEGTNGVDESRPPSVRLSTPWPSRKWTVLQQCVLIPYPSLKYAENEIELLADLTRRPLVHFFLPSLSVA